ncbi:unnamed protein product [Blepharisma stoltei]|uniref:Cysteine-rich protein n=1 Tax=Blepharisma stoltei TaxID=1481888 RepID=A0AAU9IQC3_9CILI|nr:unnamed protein product [Blepharisma stoltei]
MGDLLICKECDKGNLPLYAHEEKTEEYMCVYCQYEMEAECLVDGQPCCVECKMNRKSQMKSPAGSIRSEKFETGSTRMGGPGSTFGGDRSTARTVTNIEDAPKSTPRGTPGFIDNVGKSLDKLIHRRADSNLSAEHFKAHRFLQKYIAHNFNELTCLYDSRNDGRSSVAFHRKCDDSKGGIIMIITLSLGYEIAAWSWKGIRKGCTQNSDVQMGGAIIQNNSFDFCSFADQVIINEPEGIRFSSESDLYMNFDYLERSVCNFDKRLKGNARWTTYIEEISVYKLQIIE